MTNSMITRSRSSSIQKPAPLVASDQLAKEIVYGQKASKNARGIQTMQIEEQACVPNGTQVMDTMITEDDVSSETESENIEKDIEDWISSQKARKVRGKNKNKKILALKDGEKLEIQFYNNRGVGPNHKCWFRHLGKIVRDKHICPVRVHTWKEMPDLNKQHMWDWVKEYFLYPKLELYREHTLEHMGALWTAWRSSLNTKYFKPCKTKALSLKNVSPGMDVKDWEWLVTERFLSDEFQEISARNSNNRVNGVMPHRTGSQPHRQIIYEMGGNVDTPQGVAKIFYSSRQKKGKLVDIRDQEKYTNAMIIRSRSSSIQKPSPLISSDQLTKENVYGQKASKNAHGIQMIQIEEQACVPNGTQVRDAVITEDDVSSDTKPDDNIEKNIEDSISDKARKVRGRNKNKKILALMDGEKLEIQFYNNRGVGPNHKCWSRHLGKIVRDKHICPVRVHTWKEMPDKNKQHMWDWVKECFSNPKMELYREHTLEHMGSLWTAWRSSLNTKYFKPFKTKELSLKNVPPGMDVKDWEWLVTERFLSDEFQEISSRNSNNRVNGVMTHRSGSQPHRQIIYEMGGKVDTPPEVAKIFYATRQKNGKLVDARDQELYDEILKTVPADASLEPIEVVETCFGPQSHRVFGFGGGIKRKHFDDKKGMKKKHCNEPEAAYIKELEAKLHEKDEENNILIRRIEAIERRLSRMENHNEPTPSDPSTCGDGLE